MSLDTFTRRGPFLGVFLLAMATLMHEVLLTRIFSVTMWYHYAFAAISVAMFGMTVGANCVYLFPNHFAPERSKRHLTHYSLWFSVMIVLSFALYLRIPFADPAEFSAWVFGRIALTYAVVSIPFVFSGIAICLALTRFPSQVSRIYASDLAGAALGCPALVYLLEVLDGPSAVVFIALVAASSTFFFAGESGSVGVRRAAYVVALGFIGLVVANAWLAREGEAFLRLRWVKGGMEGKPLYEKWNSFSRIHVQGNPDEPVPPESWGSALGIGTRPPIRRLSLWLDSTAQTHLIGHESDERRLEFLKGDVTAFAYHVRTITDVLVVGTGGGRDVLTALQFDAARITGVEINRNVLHAVNVRFGDFTGHLDRNPRVQFINDEARSYITRQKGRFGLIQIPMIDTWAATAAGAFVLSENALYTVEACTAFLEKLKPNGMLSITRWHVQSSPWEISRTITLVLEALKRVGAKDPRDHLLVISAFPPLSDVGVATVLASRSPFALSELYRAEGVAARMRFRVDISPRSASTPLFESLASGRPLAEFSEDLPVTLAPPTDDSPFFFNMLKFSHVLDREAWGAGPVVFNQKAVFALGALLLTATILTLAFILLPLWLRAERPAFRTGLPLFLLFAAIGIGFMLVEISQLQRLTVFLGHPTYSLTVVLFAILLSSGLGSFLTRGIVNPAFVGVVLFLLLLGSLTVYGCYTPRLVEEMRGESTGTRILVAAAILSGIGIFLGMPFPLGMKAALVRSPKLAPWLWGINGATSVLASILAVVIALLWGISVSFWAGLGCYVVATLAFIWSCLQEGYSTVPKPNYPFTSEGESVMEVTADHPED